ncbi:hypothetical protein ACET9I_21345 [Aeromonas veronii]|nr:hypothetical protein [Aeromonas veronii]EKP0293534.1 hypothetical protein [Aeromonas veronii]MCR3965297.1 hypothetical protein [Aeromonas veronii]
MAVWADGKVVRTQLFDRYFVDYLWYRTCEINLYSVCIIPAAENLENELLRASLDPNAQRFMSDNDVRDNSTLNLDRFIKVIHNEYTQVCISKGDLHWIDDKNTRLIFYIWRTLSHLILENTSNRMFGFDLKYDFLHTMQPNNSKKMARMDDITNEKISTFLIACCINRLRVSKATKLQILDHIKQAASYTLKNKEITNWLSKDEHQKTTWVFDYLLNIKPRYIPLVLPGSIGVRDDIISFFDVTRTLNEDSSKLIALTMKKTWSQRKYRDKNKEKKQYSINMSQDIGDILDKLSLARNENKNAIVEALIRAEYEKITRP